MAVHHGQEANCGRGVEHGGGFGRLVVLSFWVQVAESFYSRHCMDTSSWVRWLVDLKKILRRPEPYLVFVDLQSAAAS